MFLILSSVNKQNALSFLDQESYFGTYNQMLFFIAALNLMINATIIITTNDTNLINEFKIILLTSQTKEIVIMLITVTISA